MNLNLGVHQSHGYMVYPGRCPKKQRHFVTADLSEATSQAMLSEKQRHFVTVVSFQGMCPKKQRHFVTADLLEATSQAMLSEKQRHFVTVVCFQGTCRKNSAILLRPICGKQPHKQCCYVHNLVNSLFRTPPLITNLGQAIFLEPEPYKQNP